MTSNDSFKSYKLVEVKWLDAQTGFSQAMPLSEFKKDFEPYYNYTFGYLLEDNKDHIIIGFLIMNVDEIKDEVNEETMVKHWQLIPKGMVRNVREVK